MISERDKKLITDNPNLSNASLARFLGVSKDAVRRLRIELDVIPKWTHRGHGVPFSCDVITEDGWWREVKFKGRIIHRGNSAMENLDRLIYCLENNNGKLPKSTSDFVFGELEFIGRSI